MTPTQTTVIYGLPSQLCQLLSSSLSGRSLHLVVDGVSSNTIGINSGIPQGSILIGLDMSPYAAEDIVPCPYNLNAISNHSGTTYSGHYTSYCIRHVYTKIWHEYNGSLVSSISSNSLVSGDAYILFYQQEAHRKYEQRDGDSVKSYCSVADPDSTLRTVHYSADNYGMYNTVVEKHETLVHPAPAAHSAPVENLYSAPEQNVFSAPVQKVYSAPLAHACSSKLDERSEVFGTDSYTDYSDNNGFKEDSEDEKGSRSIPLDMSVEENSTPRKDLTSQRFMPLEKL
ncbi:unnamed protein product [Phaedon cochleariae]|uniref:ubiquitinyl hydrolase 1 n=1 Tax=Phaedon cochleariae TaxID=80249 RepID=A0A9N9SER0_PHACE|nr:unnamed protein product [Phaedon cochleariae]